MSDTHSRQAVARRSFLTRLGAGAAAFGAAFTVGETETRAQAAAQPAPWQPVRHAEDDWLEEGRAKHRFFFDTTEVRGLGHAIFWANNYCTVSRGAAYGLTDADSSVVICLRHESAPFAFTDAMWAKYGPALSEHAAFSDPKTKQPATVNVFQARATTTFSAIAGRRSIHSSATGFDSRCACWPRAGSPDRRRE